MRPSIRLVALAVILLPVAALTAQPGNPARPPAADLVAGESLKGSLITLRATDDPTIEVLKDLARQSGIPLGQIPQEVSSKTMTIDATKIPFWDAMTLFSEKSGFTAQIVNDNRAGNPGDASAPSYQLTVGRAVTPDHHPTQIVGPFRIRLDTIQIHKSLAYAFAPAGLDTTEIHVIVEAEPAIGVSAYGVFANCQLFDDQGAAIPARVMTGATTYAPILRGQAQWQSVLLSQSPAVIPTKFSRISFNLMAHVSESTVNWEIPNVLTAGESSQEMDTYTLVFKSITPSTTQKGQFEAEIDIQNPPADGTELNTLLSRLQRARLQNKSGGGYTIGDFTTINNRNPKTLRQYRIAFIPSNGDPATTGEPTTFSVSLPTGTKTVRIPVEFKDIKIP